MNVHLYTTHQPNCLWKLIKQFVRLSFLIALLLSTATVGYAQNDASDGNAPTKRVFLPLVASNQDKVASEPMETIAADEPLDPSIDTAADYDPILTAESPASVEAAGSGTTFFVTKVEDTEDGTCSPVDCSLREASAAAAADPTTHDNIMLFGGIFPITTKPLQLVNVTLIGVGATQTVLENVGFILNVPMNTIEIPIVYTYPPLTPVLNTWVQLEKLTIRNNQFGNPAAGIKHSWGKLTLKNVRIQKHRQGISSIPLNLADSKGIFLYNSDIDTNGKGLVIEQGSGYLENSVVRNSETLGLEIRQSNITFANTTVSSNAGGGIYLQKSTGDIFGSALIFNQQYGIFVNASTLNLTNSTVSSNDSTSIAAGLGVDGDGAGLWVGQGSTANLTFVTIAKNKVNNSTAGLYVSPNGKNTINLQKSLVADNVRKNGQASDCMGTLISGGYNLFESTTGCILGGSNTGNIIGTDPKLGTLALNGGTTKNHQPASNSPAVDAIQGAACPNVAVDQRNIVRPRDGNSDGVWGCDIGALER